MNLGTLELQLKYSTTFFVFEYRRNWSLVRSANAHFYYFGRTSDRFLRYTGIVLEIVGEIVLIFGGADCIKCL